MNDKDLPNSIPATSMNLTEHNLEQLKALFPNVFTENKVDFDALKAELGEHVERQDERYQFTWAGKEQAKRIATTPSLGTLRPAPEESVNWDETENLYIEGDNLEVLKLLQKSYFNKVKMIYIDPPYNTGKDFVYRDDFKDNLANYQRLTGQRDKEGNPLFTNTDNAGRYHSNWLNMMYPRLKLARNLLKDDGVIFISIDSNEVDNLKKIGTQIFGEDNFLSVFIWEKRTSRENRKVFSTNHDYIIAFSKNRESFQSLRGFLPYTEEVLNRYRNPDGDHRGVWQSVALSVQGGHGTASQFYEIETPSGRKIQPPSGLCWRYTKAKLVELIQDNRIWFGANGENTPRLKLFLSEIEQGLTPHTLWRANEVGTTDSGKREVNLLFEGVSVFDTPKPVKLMERCIQISSSEKNGIFLDFFSGSATMAHGAMQLNAKDGGERKFIMVQIPEPTPENSEARKAGYATIAEIGKERIRRAANKIREEHQDTETDLGFKVLKLDSSNIKKWQPDYDNLQQDLLGAVNNIVDGRSSEDLLYEVLIKYGLPLTLPVETLSVAGHTVYNVAGGSLVACFDEGVTLDTVQAIIGLAADDMPILRIVFRDTSFADDIVKTNAIQRFKQAGIEDVLSI